MQQHSSWLHTEENADKWDNGKISAKERRVLISNWVGAAYKKVNSPQYQSFQQRMFEKAGCLITADGSDDDKIKPEDLPKYHVLPPYYYNEATSALPEIPTCEPAVESDNLQALEEVTGVSDKDINEKN